MNKYLFLLKLSLLIPVIIALFLILHQIILYGKFFEVDQFIKDLHHEDLVVMSLMFFLGEIVSAYLLINTMITELSQEENRELLEEICRDVYRNKKTM